MTDRPALSVVVPSVNDVAVLGECLRALEAERATGVPLEVLVVDRCGAERRQAIAQAFPEAVVIAAPPRASIPAMRALGFGRARADAVAVIEDHVLVPRGWARRMLDALDPETGAVGGTVRNAATGSAADWAAFLCEYSHLLAPKPAGVTSSLTGNNVVYRRAVLDRYVDTIALGRWEDTLHSAMRRDGVRLVHRPDIVAAHKLHGRARDYAAQRYLYSRMYAGQRASDFGSVRRVLAAAATVALPPVLLTRIVWRTLAAGGHGAALLVSLPLLPVLVCVWAAGEAVGYLAGPGDAPGRVK